jgi:DNA-binding NarL/FixJ family response regulator
MFRDGIKSILEKDENITVVGEVDSANQIIEAITNLKPDLVLLDIAFEDGNGLEIVKEIRLLDIDVKIIILTMHQKAAFLHDALNSNVDGYVLKSENSKELLNAIKNVMVGALYISKQSRNKKKALDLQQKESDVKKLNSDKNFYLTEREKEIIKLISEGLAYKKIAEKLFVSQYTVINHRQNIAHKLALKSNMSIVKFALEHQII